MSTSLLLHCDGANDSTTFADSSPVNKTVTAHGNAKISTDQYQFNGASAYLDGSGDYLTVPNSGDFNFGAGDFTVELFFNSSRSQYCSLIGNWGSSGDRSWNVYQNVAINNICFYWSTDGSNYFRLDFPFTYANNTWYHLAVVRASNILSVYINGTSCGAQTFTDTLFNSPSQLLAIGSSEPGGGTENYQGYIDELRITKGLALYTSNFTPPTAPFSEGTSSSCSASIDALVQRTGIAQTGSLDALIQSSFTGTVGLDTLLSAVKSGALSLDALIQVGNTQTVSADVLIQAEKNGSLSVDALIALLLNSTVGIDALVQGEYEGSVSMDAALQKSFYVAALVDAFVQSVKSGALSLDAILISAVTLSETTGLDGLVQAVKTGTLSLDAMIIGQDTAVAILDALVTVTRTESLSLDALLSAVKSGALSLDALILASRDVSVSVDGLIQQAKSDVTAFDAILAVLYDTVTGLDAWLLKTRTAGLYLDTIIGLISSIIMPAGRVIEIGPTDRLVVPLSSDRLVVY